MEIRMIVTLLITSLIVGCGLSTQTPQQPAPNNERELDQQEQFGTLQSIDGSQIDFDQFTEQGWIMIFASDTCITCSEEAQYWVQEFKRNGPFANIKFVTYLIGNQREDAQDWRETFSISWPIVQQPQDTLYRRLCPEIKTPCTVLYNKQNNRVLQTFAILKRVDIENFFKETP